MILYDLRITKKDYSFCSLIDFDKLYENEKKTVFCFANSKVYKCKTEGETFPNKRCKGCVYCRIIYYPDTNNCRIKKECEFKEILHELKERLLYDAFKKWVDKLHCQYLCDS